MTGPRVLLLVNGLGLGNSTRCHAVIQRLAARGIPVDVVTSGNGAWYFRDRSEIGALHEVESLFYARKEGRLSIAATVASARELLSIQRRNNRRLGDILDELRPAVVVTDSMYTFSPMRRRGIPIYALNNADVVVAAYGMFQDRPKSIRAQFHAVEATDALFHRIIPAQVISPTLTDTIPGGGGKIRRVGPIVRREYQPSPRSGPAAKAVVMLSGSVFGTPVELNAPDYPIQIHVVGRPKPPQDSPSGRVTYHGKVLDTLPIVQDADVAVVNGGFSAVSEMFFMRKPMVVVPVPNHAEQWVNARVIEHLGVGRLATEDTYEQVMLEVAAGIDRYRKAYDLLPPCPDGAEQAAGIIEGALGRR